MAFEMNSFLVVYWRDVLDDPEDPEGPTHLESYQQRVEMSAEKAAEIVVRADPMIDVWYLKIFTNRNTVNCIKTKLGSSGPTPITRDLQMIDAAGEGDLGATEVITGV
ncbi:unnamed protein product [marine sediment metagenome]|uniref:Uncharacterized protein n=1 Tax=marine sediment metagenome TaxID=412755 RepID=X0W0L0_9ZZZZ